ncbi:acyl-CoA dehydrogenase family protein [Nocardia sp. NPDC059239]|uniref:acyl-CoA dehydrogenase family protein n=1 Tax=Nocardia sp. NPDC059239 TaxID=3346785 RepID=UPI00368616B4
MPDCDVSAAMDTDCYPLFDNIPSQDRAHWERAREFIDEAAPQMNEYWDRAEYPLRLVKRMGELNLLADGIEVEGRESMSSLAAGVVNMEITRGDGSLGTESVHALLIGWDVTSLGAFA